MNVVLYGPGGRWAMTERGEAALSQERDALVIGPSAIRWQDDMLVIDVEEVTTPHLQRLRGQIRVKPKAMTTHQADLTSDGAHFWRPFAPDSVVEVDIDRPGWRWDGHGYFDANFGTRALEADFRYWTWARLPMPEGGAVTLYDAEPRLGEPTALALQFDAQGAVREIEAPPKASLRRGFWGIKRETRADPGYRPTTTHRWLDAPFYTRSAIRTKINGVESIGVHEALDCNRFANNFIRSMLMVRMPRRRR